MAARLIRLGWVEQMDLGNMPNVVANLQDVYKNVTWDPTNDHHVPWQSGMTGLGFDKAKTGDLTSLDALYDPKYKGKVDYLTEMRDTIGLTMLKLGPRSVEGDQGRLRRGRSPRSRRPTMPASSGRSRATSTPRTSSPGNVVLSMAWSGDIVQAQPDKPTLAFNVADRGRDALDRQLLIPKGAKNRTRPRS